MKLLTRSSLLSVLAATLLLPAAVLPVSAAHVADDLSLTSSASEKETAHPLDFSDPAISAHRDLSPAELLARLAQETISPLEADYVNAMLAGHRLSYSDAIPHHTVSTFYEADTLTVTARPHTYTAANGTAVTWTPTHITLGERRISLTDAGGIFTVTLSNVPEPDGQELTVGYTAILTVLDTEANGYRNYTFHHAQSLHSEQKAYEAQLAAVEAYTAYMDAKARYDAQQAAYTAYCAEYARYEEKLQKYQTYQAALTIYNRDLATYETYVSDQKAYETNLAAYRAALEQYIRDMQAYDQAYKAYELYQNDMAVIATATATLDSAFISSSEGKQMYATLMGDTVASVVRQKALLVSEAGCDPKVIDATAESTTHLQELLTAYRKLPTQAEKFAFYQENYQAIRDHFGTLFGNLYVLFKNRIVRRVLMNEGRFDRFIEFLCQLYVISYGLDDTKPRDEAWSVPGRYDDNGVPIPHYFKDELDSAQIPPDSNCADPTGLIFPTEVAKPVAPVAPTRPTEPIPVAKPTPPDVVIKPTPPAEVQKPTAPEPVADPGPAPTQPNLTARQEALLAAYRNGSLHHREECGNTPLHVTTDLTLHLTPHNQSVVQFFGADGKTPLYTAVLDTGETITYPYELPTSPASDRFTYEFVGWRDSTGAMITDFGIVDTHYKAFYAVFAKSLRTYTVTWIVEGKATETVHPYGAIPVPTAPPVKPSTPSETFSFGGWRIPGQSDYGTHLEAVQRDMIYEAVFVSSLRTYTVTWHLWHGSLTEVYRYGETPCAPPAEQPPDDRFLYIFEGWNTPIAPVCADVTYTAVYRAHPLVEIPGMGPAENEPTETPPGQILLPALSGNTYTVTVTDGAPAVRLGILLRIAADQDRAVSLSFPEQGVELFLNEASVTELAAAGCNLIQVTPVGNSAVRLYFANNVGTALAPQYPLTLHYAPATDATHAYLEAADGHTASLLPCTQKDGVLTVKLTAVGTVHFRNENTVTLLPCEHGFLSTDAPLVEAGKTVTLSLLCDHGFALASLRIVGTTTGTVYNADPMALTFIMPDEPVTVEAILARKTYTVTFVVEGSVISTATYHNGDTVVLPPDPTKAADGTTVYTFVGWSPAVTAVTEDAIYTATFKSADQSDQNTFIPTDVKNREYILLIQIIVVLLTVIAIPSVLILRKRRKRKSGKNA